MAEAKVPADPEPFAVRVSTEGTTVVVTVVGEVDMATAPGLSSAAQGAIAESAGRPVVIDLNGVLFFDSHGVASLERAGDSARCRNVPLRVVIAPGRPARRIVELTGLDRVMAVYDTVEEAG